MENIICNRKRILCFGDSITWGYIPGTNHQRYNKNIRFPAKLDDLLGDEYDVIEEGLNSRRIVGKDKRQGKEGRDGSKYIIPCLDSHDPLDIVIILLGTNELKYEFNKTPKEIGENLEKFYIKVIKSRKSQFRDTNPKVIILSVPIINENTDYARNKYLDAHNKSIELAEIYNKISIRNNCYYVDTSAVEVGIDGVHPTIGGHTKIAQLLYNTICDIYRCGS